MSLTGSGDDDSDIVADSVRKRQAERKNDKPAGQAFIRHSAVTAVVTIQAGDGLWR